MATITPATTVGLKLLIDTKGKRVLCAEAGKDFVDFLFNILLLPVATVTRLLTKEAMVGCLGNLYRSVENLGDAYILPGTNKKSLLKPTNVPLLLPNIQSSTKQRFYHCSICRYNTSSRLYYANDPTVTCPSCSRAMNSALTLVKPPSKASTSSSSANERGSVKGLITYTIMDDLTVTPMSTISSITMLSKLNVEQVDDLEEKVVDVGKKEGVELLKASLQSKTVLTDVFLSQNAGKKRCT
ncbi:hypothetical protein V6N13_121825 [Hibiscus sabdariffa]|uniref:DUF674 domain-containing protein n=1 Tax=Hibiscus sabdariffa TaxID=183260 RepID=A0ABR2C658_9ROSI